jgi:hypothetical protein
MSIKQQLKITLLWITFFSIAMGFLESAVVVYLRELYYPSGFDFPMVIMTGHIALTEIIRELATMIMLIAVAFVTGKSNLKRFAWFLYSFALWDIFYYVFLKIIVDWPSSLLTWDILVLIPIVWTGPVIAPVIVSFTMILLACIILFSDFKPVPLKTRMLILAGACVVFLSFIWDFSSLLIKEYSIEGLFKPRLHQTLLKQYIPVHFIWWLFFAGEALILAGITHPFLNRKNSRAL